MARCQPASSEYSISQPTVSTDNVTQRRFIPFGVAAALIIVAVIGAYSNTFANGFHLDDEYGLIQNPWIRSLANVPHFFADPFTLTTLARNADYRPAGATGNLRAELRDFPVQAVVVACDESVPSRHRSARCVCARPHV